MYHLDIRQCQQTLGLDRLAGKTRTWHTEHSRRRRGSGKIIATRGIPITDWVTHCRTSQKLHLNPYSEYSATFMSCSEGTLFKLGIFLRHLTNTRWCKRRPGFYWFSLWFHLKLKSSQLKTIAHCLYLNCIKQCILNKVSVHVIVLHKVHFLLILREITHV